jgi:hypothetical protein
VKGVQDIEREGTPREYHGRRESTDAKELDMWSRTADLLMAFAVAETDLVNTRDIDNSKVHVECARIWTRGATVTELKNHAELL